MGAAYSSDPKVQPAGYLDAYSAVLRAANWKIFDDLYEPNNTPETATYLLPGHYDDLTLNPGYWDYYRFTLNDYAIISIDLEYMKPMGNIYFHSYPGIEFKPSGGSFSNCPVGWVQLRCPAGAPGHLPASVERKHPALLFYGFL